MEKFALCILSYKTWSFIIFGFWFAGHNTAYQWDALVKYLVLYFKRDFFFQNCCNEKCMPDLYFDIMAYFYVIALMW